MAAYVALGAAAGASGSGLAALFDHGWAAAALSWLVAGVLLWTALGLWRGAPADRPRRLGARTRPSLAARFARRLGDRPEIFGAITALLPCGVLLAAVAMAAATTSWSGGAVLMLAFAFTSGIALSLAAHAGRWLRRAGGVAPRVLAGALVAGAVVFVLRPLPALIAAPDDSGHPPGCPLHGAIVSRAGSAPS